MPTSPPRALSRGMHSCSSTWGRSRYSSSRAAAAERHDAQYQHAGDAQCIEWKLESERRGHSRCPARRSSAARRRGAAIPDRARQQRDLSARLGAACAAPHPIGRRRADQVLVDGSTLATDVFEKWHRAYSEVAKLSADTSASWARSTLVTMSQAWVICG